MAENKEKTAETKKRPPIEKPKIDINFTKYTELVIKACYHTGDFTLSLLKQIPSLIISIFVLIKVGILKLFKIIADFAKKIARPFYYCFTKSDVCSVPDASRRERHIKAAVLKLCLRLSCVFCGRE